jgi:hypothetical protein
MLTIEKALLAKIHKQQRVLLGINPELTGNTVHVHYEVGKKSDLANLRIEAGLLTMAGHVTFIAGIVPNPLKLAYAGADIIFNGADSKTRLESVTDPVKSLQDDAKFGKALVTGFIEPYKKSWSKGKYLEVAGRAFFDVGSMLVGGGEANAVAKGSKVAAEAEKAAEIANVASKAGKVTEVASTAGKVTEVAEATGKTGKASEVVADTSRAAKGTVDVAKGEVGAAKSSSVTKTVESKQTGAGHFTESADEAYEMIRGSNTDVNSIAQNTGIKASNIQKVKDHLFHQEHLLDRYVDLGIPAEMRRFDSEIGISNAWKRLENGTYTPNDIQLLRHEAAEASLMKRWGDPSYTRAHSRAQKRYPSPPFDN